jgi:membrane-bound ClpP family serine protease
VVLRGKKFTAYALITTILELAAVGVVGFWLLPKVGVNIPFWIIIIIMVVWAAYNILTYRPSKRALDMEIPTPAEAMIGCRGTAKTCLAPDGMVHVEGGLWKAQSVDSAIIEDGEEIVVVGIKGLLLSVTCLKHNINKIESQDNNIEQHTKS